MIPPSWSHLRQCHRTLWRADEALCPDLTPHEPPLRARETYALTTVLSTAQPSTVTVCSGCSANAPQCSASTVTIVSTSLAHRRSGQQVPPSYYPRCCCPVRTHSTRCSRYAYTVGVSTLYDVIQQQYPIIQLYSLYKAAAKSRTRSR